jgi:hypothetical protein
MPLIDKSLLAECLLGLLRPIVKLCLKNTLKIQDLTEIIKIAFIEEAKNLALNQNEKPTSSKLSVMTGVHRRDVMRLASDDFSPKQTGNIVVKVVGHWIENYKNANGSIGKLTFGSDVSEFSQMVREISKDLHPQSILSELIRIGQVVVVKDKLELKNRVFNPKGDFKKAFGILAQDCNDLIFCVEENLLSNQVVPNLHMRTEYDRVICDDIPDLKKWFLEQGDKQHESARKKLAKMDLDLNPKLDSNSKKLRVVFGSYSWMEEVDES